ncbi:MAG: hypothetical protein WBB23_16800 [Desulforhopalus sp.]
MDTQQPALRLYLEIIEKQCRLPDRDRLTQLILTPKKQVDPGKRNAFLESFHSIFPIKAATTSPKINLAELQTEIEKLHKIIRASVISIDDGSYWDDPDDEDWEDFHYRDEGPEPMNDEQTAAIILINIGLFERKYYELLRP